MYCFYSNTTNIYLSLMRVFSCNYNVIIKTAVTFSYIGTSSFFSKDYQLIFTINKKLYSSKCGKVLVPDEVGSELLTR